VACDSAYVPTESPTRSVFGVAVSSNLPCIALAAQEPYRFMAIQGSEDLIQEAGPRLHHMAAALVGPLRRALETREAVTVAVAMSVMALILRTDKEVRHPYGGMHLVMLFSHLMHFVIMWQLQFEGRMSLSK
jgi:hypothetical protein